MSIILVGILEAITHKPENIIRTTGEVVPECWEMHVLEKSPTEVNVQKVKVKLAAQRDQWNEKLGKQVQVPVRLFSPEKSRAIYFSLAS